jgi:hypothetical protein
MFPLLYWVMFLRNVDLQVHTDQHNPKEHHLTPLPLKPLTNLSTADTSEPWIAPTCAHFVKNFVLHFPNTVNTKKIQLLERKTHLWE